MQSDRSNSYDFDYDCPRCGLQVRCNYDPATFQLTHCEFCRARYEAMRRGKKPPEVPTDDIPAGRLR